MNKVIIIGRNTKDIELRTTPSGTSAIEFSIAVNRAFKNANGERESDFFNCVAFSKLAETISKYVNKGDQLGVEGRLQTRNYTNKEGKKVYVTEIIVENVEFLQTKKQEEQKPDAYQGAQFYEADPFKSANFEEVDNEDGLPF
jgi:single-strand DNA-binding protein